MESVGLIADTWNRILKPGIRNDRQADLAAIFCMTGANKHNKNGRMIQTGLIPNAHADLVTDAAYDFYGLKLATCSLDQRIKIWQVDEQTGNWTVEDEWRAHTAPIAKLSWAHPEFGTILASAAFDRTVKVWELAPSLGTERTATNPPDSAAGTNGATTTATTNSRWIERAVLVDARGTVRCTEFAPRHFGLKLATISTDNYLRIYECMEQPSLSQATWTWQLAEEIDAFSLPLSRIHSPNYATKAATVALATPTQTHSSLDGSIGSSGAASASLVAQALQQASSSSSSGTAGRPGLGNREADGGWSLSWCKDRYWGEVIAVASGVSGWVKVIQISPSRRPQTVLILDPSPVPPDSSVPQSATSTRPGLLSSTAEPGTPAPHSALPHLTTLNSPVPSPSPLNPSSQLPVPPSIGGDSISRTKSLRSSNPSQDSSSSSSNKTPFAVTSVSWAPSCGRTYHLVATGSRDGFVRIWKIRPPLDEDDDSDPSVIPPIQISGMDVDSGYGAGEEIEGLVEPEHARWSSTLVGEFDQHKSSVGRVEWNITGTTLSSSGNDGRVRLWKASSGGNIWRPAGSIGIEQHVDDESKNASGVNGSGGNEVEMSG